MDYRIGGTEGLDLHHLYRAMGWLGENRRAIEESLFRRRRDLFTEADLVFFDTTSIYFEGEGGESLGQYGHSKDHRPDLKQMVVAAVLDGEGRPVCCELWPGNTTDVRTLMPIVDRLRSRFSIERICIVADRGMISAKTVEELESPPRHWQYILGARMRKQKEVSADVLSRGGRYQTVHPRRRRCKDPSPLKVKEVVVEGRRYVVCLNEEEARKDAHDREAIVASLRERLKRGNQSLVGNRGYRKYLKQGKGTFEVDEAKIQEEARYDGKWVLRTNTDLSAADAALKYKQLWMVEHVFRSTKSVLDTRPIWHKRDETIRGHVFCSFLALVLRKELEDRLEANGQKLEWAEITRDLMNLQYAKVEQDGKRFLLRSEAQGTCGRVFAAAGVALPRTIQQIEAL
jgi:transposase